MSCDKIASSVAGVSDLSHAWPKETMYIISLLLVTEYPNDPSNRSEKPAENMRTVHFDSFIGSATFIVNYKTSWQDFPHETWAALLLQTEKRTDGGWKGCGQ